MQKGFSDTPIPPCPLAPMQNEGRGDLTLLPVLDSQLPVLQLLLQVTCLQQEHVCFLERRVRPSSMFWQTSSNLEAEPSFSAGPSHSVASLNKASAAKLSLFLECMSLADSNFTPFCLYISQAFSRDRFSLLKIQVDSNCL